MISKHSTLFASQITDQLIELNTFHQRVLAEGLVSSFQGGSISLKAIATDLYGNPVDILLTRNAMTENPTMARLSALSNLAGLTSIPDADLQSELEASRLTNESPIPDEIALIHASLDERASILITHPSILAVGCTVTWQGQVQAIFGKDVAAIPYSDVGPDLYQAIRKTSQVVYTRALFLRYYGLLVWADDLEKARQTALGYTEKAQNFFSKSLPTELIPTPLTTAIRVKIAEKRQEISEKLKNPQLMRVMGSISAGTTPEIFFISGAPSVAHQHTDQSQPSKLELAGLEPILTIHACDAVDLECQANLFLSDLQIRSQVKSYDKLDLLPLPTAQPSQGSRKIFSGEVALVSGAATGIGQAAVASLLERGAAVVGLDIKPEITSLFDSQAYLGLECDLTDETATLICLEKMVRTFGGLDMLVLNAGIFPASCNLESLTLEHWRKVMRINLDVNVTLLREAFPLLKRAPHYGRVVINASRNVPAPGPGAAAYSASKAALTQLGRVAALEWASFGIRVNMLNPHAVFDTGLWTDEIIHSRAAKYGLSVEQYKTNNLLHVELTSHDLGELIAETMGPLFSKTTGAQIPVDGGSDRVI